MYSFFHTYLKSLYNNITLLGVFELFSLLNNSEKKIDFHPGLLASPSEMINIVINRPLQLFTLFLSWGT